MPDSSLTEFDNNLLDGILFKVLGKLTVDFQFAPKITSDSNSSSWHEKDVWAIELLRIHRGSVGRRVTMEWEYVATDKKFTGAYIKQQLQNLKAYYFEFTDKDYPIIEVKYLEVIPEKTFFRLRDSNIQHSNELVDNGGKYPLHTKVAVTLELATAVNSFETPSAKDSMKVNLPPVNNATQRIGWY